MGQFLILDSHHDLVPYMFVVLRSKIAALTKSADKCLHFLPYTLPPLIKTGSLKNDVTLWYKVSVKLCQYCIIVCVLVVPKNELAKNIFCFRT